jgi:Peptidase family M28
MKKNLFALLLAFALLVPTAAFGQKVQISASERKMAEAITADQLSNWLYFVASDAMGGRDTPSYGLDVTAEWLKMNLQRWGFKGAGDNGGFFQKMDMIKPKINFSATTATVGGQQLKLGSDFIAGPSAGSLQNAKLVFVGDGWLIKSKNLDPYRGLDVKGKVVVVMGQGLPRGMTFQQLQASGKQGVDWMAPAVAARENGAVGMITLANPQITAGWDRSRRQMETGGNFSMDKLRDPAPSFPSIILSESASQAILAGESVDYAKISAATAEPVPGFSLADSKSASLNIAVDVERVPTQNVLALWEGSDPVLKNEMVAVGAHYDHDGTRPNAPGPDKIWNGADDDGSGTVAVLAIAEALAKAKTRPKRSVLLVWHTGEEKGLLGAEYFNKYPTVNIKNVIAQLNIDMIGRSKKEGDTNPANKDLTGNHAIYVIGKDMMSSTLGSVVADVNSNYLKMAYDLKYDDPKDTNRFFFRSDHYHYAVNGIPIAFWFNGTHEDYHRPTDHPDKIDYDKMEKVTRTIFLTLFELTDLKERPKIDKQLPAELTQR